MPFPILQKGHTMASGVLHKAGLTLAQIPQAIDVTKNIVENWFATEVATGNAKQAFLVLKGQVQEKGPKILYNQLQETLLLRLVVHLGIRGALASNIATLLLPFVLKRVYAQVSQNSKVQAWWQEHSLRQRVPTAAAIKNRITEVKNSFRTKTPEKE